MATRDESMSDRDEPDSAPLAAGQATATDHERLLSVYLSDHAAGARAGIALSDRSRKRNEGTEFGEPLARFHRELKWERASLERFMAALGCETSNVKDALGLAGVWLGQLKLSGRLISYSPLSRVLELEALIGAVGAKRRLWNALRIVNPDRSIPAEKLTDLIDAADRQIADLERLHRAAVTIAFGGNAESAGN